MPKPAPDPDPASEHVLRSLMSAGVSQKTARAMAGWKAREVLDLLNDEGPPKRPPRRRPLRSQGGTI
ncbi:MAG TPA: hypothetical protein VJU79_08900 [Candidatus Dormibacteraeota bacterium]|nr:hypothetical protein [Candidatus Dormibacteraeota bacterium]